MSMITARNYMKCKFFVDLLNSHKQCSIHILMFFFLLIFISLRWFEYRQQAEEYYSIPVVAKACKKGGFENYALMDLAHAKLPELSGLVPDDSPDVLKPPVPESRYTSEDYDNYVGGKFAGSLVAYIFNFYIINIIYFIFSPRLYHSSYFIYNNYNYFYFFYNYYYYYYFYIYLMLF